METCFTCKGTGKIWQSNVWTQIAPHPSRKELLKRNAELRELVRELQARVKELEGG